MKRRLRVEGTMDGLYADRWPTPCPGPQKSPQPEEAAGFSDE
ncbi:hypothetical protein HMPREF9440_01010 [Sutterella parvirubra YIT 11816]|uniref:Uncharacterized protein n=1 Tax=Sutterella parvirubra YIT 11816 TaxID=762967 RepID=H3KE48_9BURK|nr:hypothetical protein HMPREF9440_01010 [Sutterella parvirubra YIT 11816]